MIFEMTFPMFLWFIRSEDNNHDETKVKEEQRVHD